MITFIIIIAICGFSYAAYLTFAKNIKGEPNKAVNSSKGKSDQAYNARIESINGNIDIKKREIEEKFNSNSSSPINFYFNGLPFKFEEEKYTAFDFELADDNELSVVKLSIAHFEGIKLINMKEYYFSPATKIDSSINKFKYSKFHRITLDMVSDKPTILDEWENIKDDLNGRHLVAHNSDFDINILRKIITVTKSPLKKCTITCTSYYSKLFIKWMHSLKLEEICLEHKIPYWKDSSKFKSVSAGVLFIYLSTLCTEKSFNIFITGKKVNLSVPK